MDQVTRYQQAARRHDIREDLYVLALMDARLEVPSLSARCVVKAHQGKKAARDSRVLFT